MVEISAVTARRYWLSIMENVAALLSDAQVLLDNGSAGRARTLEILAREELGKAQWVHSESAGAWVIDAERVELGSSHSKGARLHVAKLPAAITYSAKLPTRYGYDQDHPTHPRPLTAKEMEILESSAGPLDVDASAAAMNAEKQAGLYVDLNGETISRPSDVSRDWIGAAIAFVAEVALMHVDEDHAAVVQPSAGRVPASGQLRRSLVAMALEADGTPRRMTSG